MKAVCALLFLAALALPASASPHLYVVPSPTHAQTFAYGSDRHRQWLVWGRDRHLALATEFTNDPYVDQINIRQYDDFVFQFPSIRLGSDGRTFYYRAPDGRRVAVADCHPAVFGIDVVALRPGRVLLVSGPHGYLSVSLLVTDEVLSGSVVTAL